MIGEAELGLHNRLPLFTLVNTLSEKVRVLIEEEERETGDKLLLTGSEDLHLVLLFFVVVVEDLDWAPNVFLVLVNGRQSVGLVRPRLAVINPLFNSFVLLPGVVTRERFDAGEIGATVEDLILLVEYL